MVYPNVSDGFLLDEDNALRRHLMGLEVSDDANTRRNVGVWFSHPDNEIREQRYPYIVIQLIDITEASNRVHSGKYEPLSIPVDWILRNAHGVEVIEVGGVPLPFSTTSLQGYWTDLWVDTWALPLRFEGPSPIPVQIDYQVRAFSRHPRHSRTLIASLLGRKIPYRYGTLDMEDIDGSWRRVELLDIAHGESIESQKRLFISVFTIRVDGFMPYSMDNMADIRAIDDNLLVASVYLDVFQKDSEGTLLKDPDTTETAIAPGSWDHYDRPAHLSNPPHTAVAS